MKHASLSLPRTFQDLHDFILTATAIKSRTRADYVAQIKRCPEIYAAFSLSDIPFDKCEFEHRWPRTGFNPEYFTTQKAYLAWRRKMLAAMKHATGDMEATRKRLSREDEWSILLHKAKVAAALMGLSPVSLIPLHALIDEARIADLKPAEITAEWLAGVCDSLHQARSRSLVKAALLLDKLRINSMEITGLLPQGAFGNITKIRRMKMPEPSPELTEESLNWIMEHCRGEFDEILESYENTLSESTVAVYRAAFAKYLGTAVQLRLLQDCPDLKHALRRDVFHAVMRAWIGEQASNLRISEKTMLSYVTQIMAVAAKRGLDVSFMAAAKRTNRSLQKGKADGSAMSHEAIRFCAHIMRSRRAEMRFRSLHVHFQKRCIDLLEKEKTIGLSNTEATQVRQLGTLAAFASIELWGPPLRISNAIGLRLYGASPTIFLPKKAKTRAEIHIPKEETKNNKPIDCQVQDGRTRATEILIWYIENIRPRLEHRESVWLFPGSKSPDQPLSSAALRNALKMHARHAGVVMQPHWFRHGVASLYLREHPGGYDHIARLLDDKPSTVRRYYGWTDDEAMLEQVQSELVRMAGLK